MCLVRMEKCDMSRRCDYCAGKIRTDEISIIRFKSKKHRDIDDPNSYYSYHLDCFKKKEER